MESIKSDITIIGAGPAGLSSAIYAGRRGANIIIIEMKREIGVPIQCGEFLPSPIEIKEILPNARHTDLLIKYPSSIILNKINHVRLYSPNGIEYKIKFNGVVIDREKYDKWLAKEAIKLGAKLFLNTKAVKIEDNRVYIKGPKTDRLIRSEVIILASGAASKLRSGIVPKLEDNNFSVVSQQVMGGVNLDAASVYMLSGVKYAPGAYGWVIPRGSDEANVGTGIRKPYVKGGKSVNDYLYDLIYKNPIVSKITKNSCPLSIVGGIVPSAPPLESAVHKNIMLVGDIANMVIAFIGAGVPPAVISGSIAGEVAAQAVINIDIIHEYNIKWRKEIGEELKRGYLIRRMMDPILKNDRLIEAALEMLGERYLSEIIRARIPKVIRCLYNMYDRIMKFGVRDVFLKI